MDEMKDMKDKIHHAIGYSPKPGMFYSKGGMLVIRLRGGIVGIVLGNSVTLLDESNWCSTMASVCKPVKNADTVKDALRYHSTDEGW